MSVSAPAATLTVLDNGLRVAVVPDNLSATSVVAVAYGVGYRTEPVERPGLAHLCEHLMFHRCGHGSHARSIEALGGFANAATHPATTVFVNCAAPSVLRPMLALEAARMSGGSVSMSQVRDEIDIVDAELTRNITGKAFGGFPWMLMPSLVFGDARAAHNGYGSIDELRMTTPSEVEAFFSRFYRPDNATVVAAGPFEPSSVVSDVHSLFGSLVGPAPEVAPPAVSTDSEPAARSAETTTETVTVRDRIASCDAIAVGWPLPDTVGLHLAAMVVLAELAGGRDRPGSLSECSTINRCHAYVGTLGYPWHGPTPDHFTIEVYFDTRRRDSEHRMLQHIDEVIGAMARLADETLVRLARRQVLDRHLRSCDSLVAASTRTAMAVQSGRGLPWSTDVVGLLEAVDAPAVRRAAARLAVAPRAVIHRRADPSRRASR